MYTKERQRVAEKDACQTPQHQAGDAIVIVVIENVFFELRRLLSLPLS